MVLKKNQRNETLQKHRLERRLMLDGDRLRIKLEMGGLR